MKSNIYKNSDGYRVLAEQFRNIKSIDRIKKIVSLPIKTNLTNTIPYLLINYEKVYKGDWVVVGLGQIEFEVISNDDFKKRFELQK